jgi:hypothetical protein
MNLALFGKDSGEQALSSNNNNFGSDSQPAEIPDEKQWGQGQQWQGQGQGMPGQQQPQNGGFNPYQQQPNNNGNQPQNGNGERGQGKRNPGWGKGRGQNGQSKFCVESCTFTHQF